MNLSANTIITSLFTDITATGFSDEEKHREKSVYEFCQLPG